MDDNCNTTLELKQTESNYDFQVVDIRSDIRPKFISKLKFVNEIRFRNVIDPEIFETLLKCTEARKIEFASCKNITAQDLFESLSKMHNLEELIFTHCELNVIPFEVANMVNLERFEITQCDIPLYISPNIANMKNLAIIDFFIPNIVNQQEFLSCLAPIDSLKDVSFTRIDLNNNLNKICCITQLKSLYLRECNIKYLPDCIGNMVNLEALMFFHNGMLKISKHISNLKGLKYFSLQEPDLEMDYYVVKSWLPEDCLCAP